MEPSMNILRQSLLFEIVKDKNLKYTEDIKEKQQQMIINQVNV